MRTSVEKVRPESNNFACLGKIIKEKAISKESCCSLRQGWFEIAFLLWVCGMKRSFIMNGKDIVKSCRQSAEYDEWFRIYINII